MIYVLFLARSSIERKEGRKEGTRWRGLEYELIV